MLHSETITVLKANSPLVVQTCKVESPLKVYTTIFVTILLNFNVNRSQTYG